LILPNQLLKRATCTARTLTKLSGRGYITLF
jgi:hypothetical protein